MDQAKQSAMLSRLGYMLNITVENGATLEEAATAAQKAQEIAFKYNLDLAAATSANIKGDNIVSTPFDLRSNHTWKRELFNGICSTNFARGLVWSGTRRAEVIAEAHNVAVIEYLYVYLQTQIMRLGNEAWLRETNNREFTKSRQGEGEGTFKDRFGRGCAIAVTQRLWQQKQTSVAVNSATALVIVKDEELKAAMTKFHPKTKAAGKLQRPQGANSWVQGVYAGREVPLNAALKG